MTKGYIITATDTDVGKTVFASMLACALQAAYWKPIQSGVEGGTDSQYVRTLTQGVLADGDILPEAYIFSRPLSPHRAAEIDHVKIDENCLTLPHITKPIIVEGAGGLLVPVTRQKLMIDLFKIWNLPLILCARTALGTINHSLLSIEAIKARNLNLHGIVFIGDAMPDTQKTILEFSGAKMLGRLPLLAEINPPSLQQAFSDNFNKADFV